jgi:serine/threonine protein kinase
VVTYEMLTGTLPFTASTAEELAHLHLEAKPIPPSEYVPDIPEPLEEIILKVLAKEPSARYRTADQLGRVLLKFGTQRDLSPAVSAPLRQAEPAASYMVQALPEPDEMEEAAEEPMNIDWLSVGLGLLAVIAVGGLVPFWMWIYFVYNPPIR